MCCVGVPFVYQCILKAAGDDEHDVPLIYIYLWIVMAVFMLCGFIIKQTMIPERCFPDGRFDIFLASHQWWHFLVNCGAFVAYMAWKQYLKWRYTSAAQCPADYDVPT